MVIDFGGGAPDAPVAGLDQWLAANSGEVGPAAADAPVLGSKKAMVLRVYFKDYANTSRFTQAQVTSIALVQGATVLDSRAVNAHAPMVTVTSPASPATWPARSRISRGRAATPTATR